MEEWVGAQWDRFIQRAANRQHAHAAVHLPEVQRAIGMLFRAGGGASAVRVASVTESRVGGPRDWLQRIAGSGTHACTARIEPEVLSLPPTVAVFDDTALNRALYLWLAAMASVIEPSGNWIADNARATRAALQRFPGLTQRHHALVVAQRALRPNPVRLKGRAAQAERAVQQALAGETVDTTFNVRSQEVAPVWLWLDAGAGPAAAVNRPDPMAQPESAARKPSASDQRRRRTEAVTDERDKAPLMMFFRAESILSWGEFIKVNRATDDDPDDNASQVADDMEKLAIAPDGQSAASRVKFDLDLPSAAADDRPLGPGQKFPEWDFRKNVLQPNHCAVQTLLATPAQVYTPAPALRATAKRVRRRLEVLRGGIGHLRSQPEGDEIDLDAWVRHRVDAASAPHSESPAVFTRRVRSERSLATLLLADLSLSTDAYATQTARVIDVIRDALYVFGEALAASGDPFEMLGFSSVRRAIRIHELKRFGEPWNEAARARVAAIKPGFYTRMGAAVRYGTQRLAQQTLHATQRREVLQQTLGFAHDRYEAGYASYLEELDAQRNLYAAELEVVRLHQAELDNRVQLYKALGGGWQRDVATPQKP